MLICRWLAVVKGLSGAWVSRQIYSQDHSQLSVRQSQLLVEKWHQGGRETKKKMFVHACANAAGWGGRGSVVRTHSDSAKNRYCKRDTELDATQLKLVFNVNPFTFAGFFFAIINGLLLCKVQPATQTGWLAGWRSCQQPQWLPPLFQPVTPYFQVFSDYAKFPWAHF